VKALLILVDGPPKEIDLPNGGAWFMHSIRALVGTDCAERIWITDCWEAWLDEDGTAAGKPVNQPATLLAQSFGWQLSLRRTIVIVGLNEETTPAALSPDQVSAIFRMTRSAP
jgi:hypothetical protein